MINPRLAGNTPPRESAFVGGCVRVAWSRSVYWLPVFWGARPRKQARVAPVARPAHRGEADPRPRGGSRALVARPLPAVLPRAREAALARAAPRPAARQRVAWPTGGAITGGAAGSSGAMPLVYEQENTGSDCARRISHSARCLYPTINDERFLLLHSAAWFGDNPDRGARVRSSVAVGGLSWRVH
jgi:hypothetical protein